jgi:hypothetical protein
MGNLFSILAPIDRIVARFGHIDRSGFAISTQVTFCYRFAILNSQSACKIAINEFGQPENEPEKSSIAVLSPRLEIQELVALVRGELFLFEQQQFMLFFCLSFRFKQMPESRPLGPSSSVTSCSRTA